MIIADFQLRLRQGSAIPAAVPWGKHQHFLTILIRQSAFVITVSLADHQLPRPLDLRNW